MIVAILSRSARAEYCAAYVRLQPDDVAVTVVLPDRGLLDRFEIPRHVQIVEAEFPTAESLGSRIRRVKVIEELLLWARSRVGGRQVAERLLRISASIIHRIDGGRISTRSNMGKAIATDSALIMKLNRLHDAQTISGIVAFDLIDLDAIVEFGWQRDIGVQVR